MKKPNIPSIPPSEITPKEVYLTRREFIKAAGVIAGSLVLAACVPNLPEDASTQPAPTAAPGKTDELGDALTQYEDITNYVNYYEFTTNKQGVARLARDFQTSPWDVQVYGLVNKPQTFSVDDLVRRYQPEERIYRLRCVEAWSMVIPWVGFPLAKLLKDVEPTADAKYVRFETIMRPDDMPGLESPLYPWPYQEGLRLDEALHDLTILATGLYGGELPAQNGGGIRLVVPWKYGFKSIKAVVKIELTADEPSTLWSRIAPNEYGFYANVNPNVDHPRWSQASERRIGENDRRKTLMFNGYAEQVAHLYAGMDLAKFY
ncbi:MAG TPA: protein-methionine-sulfoxide reductase catalytic subunit MsrP [Anaerolineaceae bacterium]|nr:protein-methionine-sulfoxide reductase catalytic subunit MsrP [Anaerolineaceae bacterium]HQF46927.1 protein-methionine-sulfoxide reductase catalytic subunit MsrP [Anaerolineaceae bacterium]HQJ04698.1 protein-methionine-sulfoxide reductase catalytic subunit MsrP [Anaerolineaceae bacterium]